MSQAAVCRAAAAPRARRGVYDGEWLRHRACLSKRLWYSRVEARRALTRMPGTQRRGLHVYQCPFCRGFHLGHRDRQQQEAAA